MDDKPKKSHGEKQTWVPPEGSTVKIEVFKNGPEIRRVEAQHLFSGNLPTANAYKRLSRKIFMFYGMKPTKEGIDSLKEIMSGKVLKTTYMDEEGDEIVFSTDDELVQACKQAFSPGNEKKVLRVKSYVVEDQSLHAILSSIPEQVEKSAGSTQKTNEKGAAGHCNHGGKKFKYLKNRIEALEQKMEKNKKISWKNDVKNCKDKSDAIVHMLSFLEAIMALLAKFTLSLKDQVANCKKNEKLPELDVGAVTEVKAVNSENVVEVEVEEKDSEEEHDVLESEAKISDCKNVGNNGDANEEFRCMDAKDIGLKEIFSSLSNLHVNYQCDGCLMNPIVGTRYRATNRPNFDVCESCFNAKNYSPSSLQFESISNEVKPQEKSVKTEEKLSSPAEFIHGRHTCDGCMMNPIVGLRYHALNLPDYDLCSMCYDKVSEKDNNDIIFEAAELDRDRLRQSLWKRKLDKGKFGRNHQNRKMTKKNVSNENKKENDSIAKEELSLHSLNVADVVDGITKVLSQIESDAFEKVVVETEKTTPNEDIVEGVEVMSSSLSKLNVTGNDAFPKDLDISGLEHKPSDVDVEKAELVSQGEASLSNDGLDASLKIDKTVAVGDEGKDAQISDSSGREIETEDEVKSNASEKSASVDLIEEVDVAHEIGGCITPGNAEAQMKNEDDISLDEATEDEWDMVVTDEKDQMKHDEMLARAAQMIGSALFEEDMKKPKVEESSESESSKLSSLSVSEVSGKSVMEPTPISQGSQSVAMTSHDDMSWKEVANTNDVAKNYWKKELDQLRDLGFGDEECVEALESLNAAHIGVNSSETIQLERVVDYLLKSRASSL